MYKRQLFNASDEPVSFPFAAMGRQFELHPVLAGSVDPVVRGAYYDETADSFEVPARTTAVFLAARSVGDQIDYLEDLVDALEDTDVLNGGQANALRAKLDAARESADGNQNGAAANQLTAFINQVEALAAAGILPPADAQELLDAAYTILAALG